MKENLVNTLEVVPLQQTYYVIDIEEESLLKMSDFSFFLNVSYSVSQIHAFNVSFVMVLNKYRVHKQLFPKGS